MPERVIEEESEAAASLGFAYGRAEEAEAGAILERLEGLSKRRMFRRSISLSFMQG